MTPLAGGRASRWSLRVLGGRLGAEWDRDRRDTLFLMGAVLLSVLPQMAWLPLWCTAGFMVLFVWRLGLVVSGRALPGTVVRMVAAAAIVAAVLAQYRAIFGRDAGVALLVLFLGLKLMEMRARRDLFVVIFLCCFLLVTGYFHSQGIAMAAATLAALLTLIASMLTMQFRKQEITIKRRFRYAATLLVQAIPIAAALFILFPRASGPLWGLPGDAHGGKTGLSDSMAPGDISDLAQSDDVVMRVQFDGPAPSTARMYWRGPTFGYYDGRAWRPLRLLTMARPELRLDDLSETMADGQPSSEPPQAIDPSRPRRQRGLSYSATVEPANHRWLLTLELAGRVPTVDGRTIEILPTFEMRADRPLIDRFQFDGLAYFDGRIGLDESEATLQPWVRLPPASNPRARALAERWLAEDPEAQPTRRIERLIQWLRDGRFTYTLAPPLLGQHTVDEFAFDTKEGFCEHFSNTFVFLARALGVPARVVTGYQGAEANAANGYWIVRQSDAHAWAEVWFDGRGWTRVDPTAVVAPDRITRGSALLRNPAGAGASGQLDDGWLRAWRLGLDSATHAWNRWVLSYDKARQESLLARLGLDFSDWREVAGAMAAVMGLILALVALVTLRPRLPRDPAERQFDQFCQRMAEIGAPRLPFETPNSYLYRIERLLDYEPAAQAQRIVAAYNRLRYDCPQPDAAGVAQLQRLVRAFRP